MMRYLSVFTALAALLYAPRAFADQPQPRQAPAVPAAPAAPESPQPDSQARSIPRPVPSRPAPQPVPQPVPEIVLYTMGQGEVIFEKFGHAALCAEYPQYPRKSVCYNYGTTDFTDPIGLSWGFLRGEAKFWSSVTTPGSMIRRYMGFDRTIWRQVLPLGDEQTLAVAAKLDHDSQEEHRYYTYHHFHDNCTTRVRDIIDEATGGALKVNSSSKPGLSFRQFGGRGFAEQTPLLVVSDFLLGRRGDVKPDLWQAMFLPDYLREEVRTRLGVEPEVLYQRRGRAFSQDQGSGREWTLLFALLLALPVAISRITGRLPRATIAVSMVPLFLLAVLLWGIAIATSLPELRYNEALLLLWPTDIVLPFLRPEQRMRYAQVRIAWVALISLLLAVGVLIQPLWAPIIVVFLPFIFIALPRRAAEAAGAPHGIR